MRRIFATLVIGLTTAAFSHSGAAQTAGNGGLTLPNKKDSLKFAAIGDNGSGGRGQYEVAAQMAAWQRTFRFEMVIMLGDNLYGSQQPRDFVTKFETPYSRCSAPA
jgi:hypothetical protein